MDEVEFHEDQDLAPRQVVKKEPTGLMKLVISTGLAEDEAGAQKVLLGVVVLAVLAIILILLLGGGEESAAVPPIEDLAQEPF